MGMKALVRSRELMEECCCYCPAQAELDGDAGGVQKEDRLQQVIDP